MSQERRPRNIEVQSNTSTDCPCQADQAPSADRYLIRSESMVDKYAAGGGPPALGDMNGDGRLDVVVGTKVLLNQCR